MEQHQAQIEELTAFRDAAAQYRWGLHEVFKEAARESAAVLRRLDDLCQDWRHEMDRCRDRLYACLRDAAMAAADGYWVDCSGYEHRLHAAEQELARCLRVRDQVQRAVDQYERRRLAYAGFLENDLGRGQEYLRAVIEDYSRFAQQQIMPPHIEQMLRFKQPFVSKEDPSMRPPSTLGGLGPRPRGGSVEQAGGPESREAGPERRG